jgi:histidine triad (HIT) family protein
MDECVFCRIVKGEAPADKIHEDERFIAILDINPVAQGHCLVIPKRHCVNLVDFDPSAAQGYLELIRALALRISKTIKADGFNVINTNGRAAQQSVDHLHFHIVPRFKGDGIDIRFHGHKKPSLAEIKALAAQLRED